MRNEKARRFRPFRFPVASRFRGDRTGHETWQNSPRLGSNALSIVFVVKTFGGTLGANSRPVRRPPRSLSSPAGGSAAATPVLGTGEPPSDDGGRHSGEPSGGAGRRERKGAIHRFGEKPNCELHISKQSSSPLLSVGQSATPNGCAFCACRWLLVAVARQRARGDDAEGRRKSTLGLWLRYYDAAMRSRLVPCVCDSLGATFRDKSLARAFRDLCRVRRNES